MRNKVITLLLAVVITIATVFGNQVSVKAISSKASQSDKLLEVAVKEIGYKEGKRDNTKYGKWYGLQNEPWCAMFVSWCADKAGISENIIPKHAACLQGEKWFKRRGWWKGRDYTPKGGDIIYFTKSHVGIVESVKNGYVNTIEGNTSNMVARRHYKLKSTKILGYGVPKYINIY